MHIVRCCRCGTAFEVRVPFAKYCPDCRFFRFFENAAKAQRKRALAYGLQDHVTAEQLYELFQRSNGRCLCCGRYGDKRRNPISFDHVIPMVLGGNNTIDNLQLLCRDCNAQKARTVKDYRAKLPVGEMLVIEDN